MKVRVYKFLSNNPDDYIYWDAHLSQRNFLETENGIYHSTRDPSVYVDCMPDSCISHHRAKVIVDTFWNN